MVTWYEGDVLGGYGGTYGIYDQTYHEVAAGRGRERPARRPARVPDHVAGHGADLDLEPGDGGSQSIGGRGRRPLVVGVVQEIDIPTGKVLFQWRSDDHVPLTETNMPQVTAAGNVDYFHLNSIGVDLDGDLLVSARHTSTVYKVDRKTGADQVAARREAQRLHARPGARVQLPARRPPPRRRHVDDLRQRRVAPRRAGSSPRRAPLRLVARHEGDDRDARRGSTCRRGALDLGDGQRAAASRRRRLRRLGHVRRVHRVHRRRAGRASTPRSATAASPTARSGSRGSAARPAARRSRRVTSGGATTVYASWNGATEVAILAGADRRGARLAEGRADRRAQRLRDGDSRCGARAPTSPSRRSTRRARCSARPPAAV